MGTLRRCQILNIETLSLDEITENLLLLSWYLNRNNLNI